MLDNCSSVLLLGTLVLAVVGSPARLVLLGALGLAAAEKYFAWRVALDVVFYDWLETQPEEVPEFDAAIGTFLGSKSAFPPRSWDSRWRGSRRLVLSQAVALVLQAVVVGALVLK